MAYTQRCQLEDGTPNWALAPPDATYYVAESDTNYEGFLKKDGGRYWYTGPDEYYCWYPDAILDDVIIQDDIYIPRP